MRETKLFLLLTIILSGLFEFLFIYSDKTVFAAFLMFTPAFVAITLKLVMRKKLKVNLNFRRCKIKYIFMSVLMPFIYVGIPYCLYWILNPSSMRFNFTIQIIVNFVITSVMNMILTSGEEIGWRGFLLPKLSGFIGEKKALFFTGFFWGLWHCPLLIALIYMPDLPRIYSLPMFMIVIICVGVIMGVITLRSGSIWPAIVMHAVHNTLDQNIFGEATIGKTKNYFTGEAGLFTVFICLVIVIIINKKYLASKQNI